MNRLAVDLRETRERLRDEREDWRSCHRRADSLEVRLAEARAEHARLQTSNTDFRAEVRLHVETQELRKGDQSFIERDRELAEVSSQVAHPLR